MGIYKLPEYAQHPTAIALMPGGMDEPEFEAFCADIQERGIIYPITLFEGMVLDGWHRYRAAKKTGCAIKEIQYTGKDPAGYIAACNVLRRKLSSLQRALVGARLHRDHGITQREACKKLGISNEVITLVLKSIDSRNTKLIKRIETESDFTRGMLKEELEDAGLLRAKPEPEAAPRGPSSVFDVGARSVLSAAGASMGLDTIGSDEEEEDFDMPEKGKRPSHPERKPKASAAQVLAEQFSALMADEKETFLRMIWSEAKKTCLTFDAPPKKTIKVLTPIDALIGSVKVPKGKKVAA